MKLLVIEDERDLRDAVARGLEKKGYAVDRAEDGEEGLFQLEVNQYDLVILDLNLPGMDGLDILKSVREHDRELKVLILSARSAVEERVDGLDLGANDYLVKPFHFAELEARVRNLLQWSFVKEDTLLSCGHVTIDTAARCAYEDEIPLPLTKTELAILEYLMRAGGAPVSAEELLEHVFDSNADPFSGSIKVHIHSLRKKLAHPLIDNLRGQGYYVK